MNTLLKKRKYFYCTNKFFKKSKLSLLIYFTLIIISCIKKFEGLIIFLKNLLTFLTFSDNFLYNFSRTGFFVNATDIY